MKRLHIFLCLWAAVAGASFDARAGAWPKLSKNTEAGSCAEALQVAKAAFDSDAFYLFGPLTLPKDLPNLLVLKPKDGYVYGGTGIEVDKDVFEELPLDGRRIHWQKTAADGHRFVVQETAARGWRDNLYSLFAVSDATSSDEFLADLRGNSAPRKFVPIIAESGQPPLIFRNRASGRYWFVMVGGPTCFLPDWHVYVAEQSGVTLRCTVQFHPEVQRATALLPKPVRKLARLLDQTLGSGLGFDEGSLRPTFRLRTAVEHTWANAALRPWVSGKTPYNRTPYNTRQEVDAGLKLWSQTGASYRKHYEAIQRQQPVAERSLARYYRQHFNRSASEAKKLSAYMLDIAIRSYYKFHSEDRGASRDNELRKSPWSKP